MGEPPVELGRAAARVGAGNERLIAQFDTKIECFRIHNYLPRVLVIFENLADDLINVECVGTGNFDRAVYRDIHEGDKIDEKALKALIRAAVALNTARPVRSQKRPKSG